MISITSRSGKVQCLDTMFAHTVFTGCYITVGFHGVYWQPAVKMLLDVVGLSLYFCPEKAGRGRKSSFNVKQILVDFSPEFVLEQ